MRKFYLGNSGAVSYRTLRVVMTFLLVTLLIAVTLLAFGCGEKKEEDGKTTDGNGGKDKNLTEVHENVMYGFTVKYPGGWVVEESSGGDGANITTSENNKWKVYVWASRDVSGESLEEAIDSYSWEVSSIIGIEPTRELSDSGTSKGAEYVTEEWTYEDEDGTEIKTLLYVQKKDDVIYFVTGEYPVADEGEIRTIMEDIVDSMTLTG